MTNVAAPGIVAALDSKVQVMLEELARRSGRSTHEEIETAILRGLLDRSIELNQPWVDLAEARMAAEAANKKVAELSALLSK